ncbi:CLIP domain-containing serine protease B4-like [Drosophila kikkawai]|uniref:CLIP domain-containing serine protease B4-like n=1 Tax=Drosophila kikkawai TaxID=30033 RepID=A0A6P4IX36_DROKI|nr:CUB and peptidase domain-containing protein 2-like [Drosophila kikkawai]
MKSLLLSLALLELLLRHKGSALLLDKNCAWTDEDGPLHTPWLAKVNNEKGFICGGALITKNYVLTAAQCLYNQKPPMFVQLEERLFNVSRGIKHRDYRVQPGPNDIGLLKLDGEVNYTTDDIRPICILMDAASVLRNKNRFYGFGWERIETGKVSQFEMTTEVRRLPSEECQHDNMPQLTNHSTQICAEAHYGPCNGDAGGPLVVIINNRSVQVGITSNGPASCNGPAVYTDVTSYTRWIASIVRSRIL